MEKREAREEMDSKTREEPEEELTMAETVPRILRLLITPKLIPLSSQDTRSCASTMQEDASPRATILT